MIDRFMVLDIVKRTLIVGITIRSDFAIGFLMRKCNL